MKAPLDISQFFVQSQVTNYLYSTMATAPKTQYVESVAEGYAAAYNSLPLAVLEREMLSKAIGDCAGMTVLDLGGGNGQYARKAVELGAAQVDVIDISPAMLELGQQIETSSGRDSKIRWFEGDATKTLQHLPLLPESYDVVMCNWVFDHASNEEVGCQYPFTHET